jgi:nucleoside-diphosphate-sugar epimerase
VFYADVRKAKRDLGWEPRIGLEDGVRRLVEWVTANGELFARVN